MTWMDVTRFVRWKKDENVMNKVYVNILSIQKGMLNTKTRKIINIILSLSSMIL